MNLGPSEIFLVMIAVLLLFGGKRLPEIARNLGRGFAEIRRITVEMKRELNADLSETPRRSPTDSTEPEPEAKQTPPEVNVNPAAQPRTSPPTSGSDS